MTITDIRKHLLNGGRVREIKDDGRSFDYALDTTMSIDKLCELFAFRSAAGMSIYRLI